MFILGFRSVWPVLSLHQLNVRSKPVVKSKLKKTLLENATLVSSSWTRFPSFKFLPQCVEPQFITAKLDFNQHDFGIIDWNNMYPVDHSVHSVEPRTISIEIDFNQPNFGLMN